MFYSTTANDKIDKLHKSCWKNIQTLCIELHKVFSGQSQAIFNDFFERKNISYNLRSQADFVIPLVKDV